MGPRRKRTCFGCRALKVCSSGGECSLDYTITLNNGFYGPGRGQICPKPETFARLQLSDELRRESIHGGG
jgi:hypothetical protein